MSVQETVTEEHESERVRRRSGGLYCSVVDCHNNTKANKDVKFFRFPKKNLEKRALWIAAVKRENPDGSAWLPTESSRVCSVHFVSGNHSQCQDNPDYKPTIFSTGHTTAKKVEDVERFQRARARSLTSQAAQSRSPEEKSRENLEVRHVATQSTIGIGSVCNGFKITYESIDSEVQCNSGEVVCFKGTQYTTIGTSEKNTATSSLLTSDFSHSAQKDLQDDFFDLDSMTDRKFVAFFGIQKNLFNFILELAGPDIEDSTNINRQGKLALFLSYLKLNVTFAALGGMFKVGEHAASRHFEQVLRAMVSVAKTGVVWYSKSQVKARLPPSFKALYPDCRVIIDCSEIPCEVPGNLKQRTLLYSHYKSRHTLKFLVGCAPSGEIMFVSQTFGGRTTDTEATIKSGFVDLIENNDGILADKGFPSIEADVNTKGGLLVMPPFKQKQRQFSSSENQEAYKCASVRVHVERCIARMKIFGCLSFLRLDQFKHIDDMLYVISYLCNMGNDLIKQD